MSIKVGINGYGRIGRNIVRAIHELGRASEFDVIALNDLGDPETNAHLTRFDTAHGPFGGTVEVDGGDIVGSIVIDGGEPEAARLGAHVRHFIVDERLRGQNVGRDLLRRALVFCDDVPYARSYLTTFAGLDAARRLYEREGYRLVDEADERTWGTTVREQLYERLHPAPDRLT